MATLSLREAAEHTGVSKSTIFRAIKAGRMSAPRNDDGEFLIDPAELFRVYPPKAEKPANLPVSGDVPVQAGTRDTGRDAPPSEAVHDMAVRLATAEAQIAGLRELLEAANRRGEEWRMTADKWEGQAERLTLALAAPKPIEMPGPVAAPVAPRTWWPWRRSA